jgi:CubicO group peptidase (beta-lactamase class C family)
MWAPTARVEQRETSNGSSVTGPPVASLTHARALSPFFFQTARSFADAAKPAASAAGHSAAAVTAEEFEHATGLELKELEAAARGESLFEADMQWLAAPLGTRENPVQVTSSLSSRIVGATDPDDDSIIHWGLVEEGKGPVQIGDEWFALKRVKDAAGGAHAHH